MKFYKMESIKEKKLVSGVVYLHNNEDRILLFLSNIITILETNFESFEIIIVNDCSSDQAISVIKNHPQFIDFNISIVHMSVHQGLESAMISGVDLSMGDFVYEFDDLTIDYDASLIMDAYYKIVKGFDIVSVAPNNDNAFSSRFFY